MTGRLPKDNELGGWGIKGKGKIADKISYGTRKQTG
jgi:hypothetical protein